MTKPYNEEKELTRYIWEYCTDSMTDFERQVGNAVVLLGKMPDSSTIQSITIKTSQGAKNVSNNFEVTEALKDGQMAFREQVMRRIMKENKDTIEINRCSKCNCVVKTPKARLCLWCGYSWYDKLC